MLYHSIVVHTTAIYISLYDTYYHTLYYHTSNFVSGALFLLGARAGDFVFSWMIIGPTAKTTKMTLMTKMTFTTKMTLMTKFTMGVTLRVTS